MYGDRIREEIKKKKLTLKQFGQRFNLAESTISGYVNENRKPDIELFEKFADFFDVDVDYLLGRTNIPKRSLSEETQNILNSLNLTDEEIRKKFPLEIDGRPVTDEEFKWFIASVRSMRSMDKK